jgi:hypothetical protein
MQLKYCFFLKYQKEEKNRIFTNSINFLRGKEKLFSAFDHQIEMDQKRLSFLTLSTNAWLKNLGMYILGVFDFSFTFWVILGLYYLFNLRRY